MSNVIDQAILDNKVIDAFREVGEIIVHYSEKSDIKITANSKYVTMCVNSFLKSSEGKLTDEYINSIKSLRKKLKASRSQNELAQIKMIDKILHKVK